MPASVIGAGIQAFAAKKQPRLISPIIALFGPSLVLGAMNNLLASMGAI